jgi:hypothetical protein
MLPKLLKPFEVRVDEDLLEADSKERYPVGTTFSKLDRTVRMSA